MPNAIDTSLFSGDKVVSPSKATSMLESLHKELSGIETNLARSGVTELKAWTQAACHAAFKPTENRVVCHKQADGTVKIGFWVYGKLYDFTINEV